MKNEIKMFFKELRNKYKHVKISYDILHTLQTTYIFIRNIYIVKKYRNNSIGKTIMSEIIKFCQNIGINITLNISEIYGTPYNLLISFYTKLGFAQNNNKNIFDGDFIIVSK